MSYTPPQIRILNELVPQIVPYLGEGWAVRIEQRSEYGRLLIVNPAYPGFEMVVGADDRFLNVRDQLRDDARVRVAGHYPSWENTYYTVYGQSSPSITVAYDRGAEAIAKEIGRRFLPDALDWYRKAVAYVQSAKAYRSAKEEIAQKLAEASGGVVGGHDKENPQVSSRNGSVSFTFKDFSPGSDTTSIEIRWVSLETALQIAAILKTAKRA